MQKKHVIYLDLLRIFATIGIICIHAGMGKFFSWCNAMFVMISGALWLSKDTINLRKLYTKNILRIITAFVFWSIFYTLFHAMILPRITGEFYTCKEILVMLISGRYHLWFCFLIVGLYIGIPFWKKIAESEVLLTYFLAVTFTFSILIPCIQNIPKLKWTAGMTQNIHWDWAEYVFYFMFGYFLHMHRATKKQAITIYTFGILSLISVGCKIGNSTILLKNLAILCLIFVLFQKIEHYVCQFLHNEDLIEKISSLCFGVYLIHDFFLTLFQLSITHIFNWENDFKSKAEIQIFQILFALFAGLSSIYLIRKIPRISKYIT